MRLPFGRKATTPDEITQALELGRGEKLLAAASDTDSGVWLVCTNHALVLVDRSRPGQWRLGEEALFLQTLRERVQASVVLTQELPLSGRRTGRAVIRQDLATGELTEQVVLGKGVGDDPEVEAACAIAFAFLREQVGMPS